MKLSPELEEICTCNNLDHTTLNYYCPANENLEMSSDLVEYADGEQFLIVLDVYTSCPNECGEKHIPILYESIEGHDPLYILGCGKCGFLDDDWDPKYVYEKEDGQIIKYYRESSDFDVVPMHPSLRNAEEALDYEGIEDQAVMFDVINMVEANDLWNEILLELIARGDAVRRSDGKIIFTDQAPGYDIIEDIAEYTTPQFEFNADGDIK
jgi:hypothetical protein